DELDARGERHLRGGLAGPDPLLPGRLHLPGFARPRPRAGVPGAAAPRGPGSGAAPRLPGRERHAGTLPGRGGVVEGGNVRARAIAAVGVLLGSSCAEVVSETRHERGPLLRSFERPEVK